MRQIWKRSSQGRFYQIYLSIYISVTVVVASTTHGLGGSEARTKKERAPEMTRHVPDAAVGLDTRLHKKWSCRHQTLTRTHAAPTTPGTLQQGTDCSPSLKVSLSLIYGISSFCNNNHLHCRCSTLLSLHPAQNHISKFDCASCHEQKLYCLGPSARYFGR